MKAPITLAMDTLVAEHVAPFLKARGFRKKGQRFARGVGDVIQVIEFDRWKYNEGSKGKFGVTLAVFHPALWTMVKEARPGWIGDAFDVRFPPVQNGIVDRHVLPPEEDRDGMDNLWPLDAERSLDGAAGTLLHALETIALPWLEANAQLEATFDRLRELSRKGEWLSSVYLLCAATIVGDRAVASEALAAVLAAKPSPFFPERERKAFKAMAASVGDVGTG